MYYGAEPTYDDEYNGKKDAELSEEPFRSFLCKVMTTTFYAMTMT